MDFTTIEANKNVIIYGDLVAASRFSQQINVPFDPDYMIVRNISYLPFDADDKGTYVIETNLLGGEYIGNFNVCPNVNELTIGRYPYIASPNLIFKLRKPVNGFYTFTILNTPILKNQVALTGKLVISVDFVKLKAEKPQKVY